MPQHDSGDPPTPTTRYSTSSDRVDSALARLLLAIVADRGGMDLSGGITYDVRALRADYSVATGVGVRLLVRVDEDTDSVAVIDWPHRDRAPALTVCGDPIDGERRVYPPASDQVRLQFGGEAEALVHRAIAEETARLGSYLRALAASPLPTGKMAAAALTKRRDAAGEGDDDPAHLKRQWTTTRELVADAQLQVVREATEVADLMRRALDDSGLVPMQVDGGPYGIVSATATYASRESLKRHLIDHEFLVFAYDGAPLETAPRMEKLGEPVAKWDVVPAHAVRFLIDAAYLIERIERVIVRGPQGAAQLQRLSAIRLADPVLADRIERRLNAPPHQ